LDVTQFKRTCIYGYACRYIANGVDVLGTILAVVLGLLYMFYQTMRALLGLIFAPSRASPAETKKRQ
jgi:ABC-type nitrate/sulfonate/bicarbonate transport system permease component